MDAKQDTETRDGELILPGRQPHAEVVPDTSSAIDRFISDVGKPTRMELALFIIALASAAAFAYGLAHQVYSGVASLIAVGFGLVLWKALKVLLKNR
jgi:hypothetical protein